MRFSSMIRMERSRCGMAAVMPAPKKSARVVRAPPVCAKGAPQKWPFLFRCRSGSASYASGNLNLRGTSMSKFISIVGTAALAIAVSMSAATPSSADSTSDAIGAGIVGGIFGFVAGSALASSSHHHVYVDEGYDYGPDYADYSPDYDYRDHVHACFSTYRSYDVRSDTYLGFDGYRHQCEL